ncbi:MAG: RNA polymerase sigma-70 factor [Tannerella sp.]|jgi:RNA polymerase sigma-70 factor (ECF subfamily)|nr:RNA polymerase sigma-70 factor [Tannerella sp.]
METHKNRLLDISLNDETVFRQMFDDYYSDLCVYAGRFISDPDICEDMVQDVFCAIWINRKKIDFSIPIASYLLTSLRRHCLNYLRKQKRYEANPETIIENIPAYAESNEELFMLHELEALFEETLASLPKAYRIAFEMSKFEDQSTSEIADVLGVSVRTVERYRNKALEILKTQLKDYLLLLLFLTC